MSFNPRSFGGSDRCVVNFLCLDKNCNRMYRTIGDKIRVLDGHANGPIGPTIRRLRSPV